MRRRDLLTGGFALAGLSLLVRPEPALAGSRLDRVLLAAATAMCGPASVTAQAAGRWDPVADAHELISKLPPDQQRVVRLAIRLLDGWPKGLKPFSKLPIDERVAWLETWRVSDNELQRSVWGLLHSLTASSFSAGEAGWEVMSYPGPVVGGTRPPGQTVAFEWDEGVP